MGDSIEKEYKMDHDILIVELNGLFYSSCKKIFHFYELSNIIDMRNRTNRIHLKLFEEVTLRLNKIIRKYPPKIVDCGWDCRNDEKHGATATSI